MIDMTGEPIVAAPALRPAIGARLALVRPAIEPIARGLLDLRAASAQALVSSRSQ